MVFDKSLKKIRHFLVRRQWSHDLAEFRRSRRLLQKSLRIITMSVYEFIRSNCPLRAAALTLVFIFSLAPALALGFAVAKGFGAQEKIKPIIYDFLRIDSSEEIAEQPDDIQTDSETASFLRDTVDRILDYAENTDAEALGLVGLLITIYAAYKVLRSIEKTMNEIWGVRRARGMLRRVVDYLAVLFIVPLMLILTAFILAALKTQAVRNILDRIMLGSFVSVLAGLAAVFLAIAGFWFLYAFFPNTRVPVSSAAVGAIVAAILWAILQSLFVRLQIGVARYNAIYGTFAAIPIFLLYLYSSWNVVLFGAEVSFAHANQTKFEYGGLSFTPSAAYRQRLSLGAMELITAAFLSERPAPSVSEISRRLSAPASVVSDILADLQAANLVHEVASTGLPRFAPCVPVEHITLGRVVDAVAFAGDEPVHSMEALARLGVDRAFERQAKEAKSFRDTTMLDFHQQNQADSNNHT